jgi:dinuclear metal center YbgI/SA1388 family protein
MKLSDLIKILDSLFEVEQSLESDNTGFQMGKLQNDIKTVLVTLDVTHGAIDEAITAGASLIISHHPLIFEPIYYISSDDAAGAKILKLAKNDISVYSAHTNYDAMQGGLNDLVFEALGLKNPVVIEPLHNDLCSCNDESKICPGFGRIGELKVPMALQAVMAILKEKLGLINMQWMAPAPPGLQGARSEMILTTKKIRKIAVINGSANSLTDILSSPAFECDLVITGEMKYSNATMIAESGKVFIAAGHAETEMLAIDGIYGRMKKNKKLAGINIIKSNTGYIPWRYYIE